MILIYDDGVHSNTHIKAAIHQVLPQLDVDYCHATNIHEGALNNAKLLIIPGGADLYFCEKLNGTGNEKIREFVSNGGSYLGICAGAYYGCASLDWNQNEIDGARELAFYEGQANGPIYNFIENKDDVYNGSWMHAAKIQTNNGVFRSEYNGGPIFTEPQNGDATVIARYTELDNTPPAIISRTCGKGQYTLSSPHIERFGHLLSDSLYKHLNESYEWEKAVIDQLLQHTEEQKKFLKLIIEQLI